MQRFCRAQRVPIASRQQIRFPLAATLPDRTGCVQNESTGKSKRIGHSDASRLQRQQRIAGGAQLWTGRGMNPRIRSSASGSVRVGWVHNGVHVHADDIVSNNLIRHLLSPG